ncbi:MAG: hypothetical protein ACI81L_001505, partial [Verrucomicrobiales bacterium]
PPVAPSGRVGERSDIRCSNSDHGIGGFCHPIRVATLANVCSIRNIVGAFTITAGVVGFQSATRSSSPDANGAGIGVLFPNQPPHT